MTNETYNGWTNYETWLAKIWMDNDEGTQSYWSEAAVECANDAIADADEGDSEEFVRAAACSLLEDRLRGHHEDLQEAACGASGLFADLLNAAIGRVNWREIARAFLDDEDIDWLPSAERD